MSDDLVLNIQEGSEEAFEILYDRYEAPLFNHIYQMLGNKEKAEEIFQETMLTVIKKIDSYRHQPELKDSLKAWIFRIATNKSIDLIRRGKREVPVITDLEYKTMEEELEIQDTKEHITKLLPLLPTIQRTFLNLKVNEDLSHKEIALICGCNINNVKQGLFRARKTLKNLFIERGLEL